MSSEAIVVPEAGPSEVLASRVTLSRPPAIVLAEAQEAAQALQGVIKSKPKKVEMNGEQYLEFEDWQILGRFYGITCKQEGDAQFVEFPGGIMGFKAASVALHNGEVISRAEAFCLNDEEKWRSKPKYEYHMVLSDGRVLPEDAAPRNLWIWEPNPSKPGKNYPKKQRVHVGEETVPLFQLASMAQTRANAKVHRNVLSWVAVLAGYKPTPAEELDGMATVVTRTPERESGEDTEAEVVQTSAGPVTVGSGDRAAQAGAEPNPAYDPSARPEPARRTAGARPPGPGDALPPCPHCGKPARPSKFPKAGQTHYCYDCRHPFSPEQQ